MNPEGQFVQIRNDNKLEQIENDKNLFALKHKSITHIMNKVLKNTSSCVDDDRINTYLQNHKNQMSSYKTDVPPIKAPKHTSRIS